MAKLWELIMKSFKNKNGGFADWVFIALIFVASIIGASVSRVTKTPDTPLEQAMEKLIHLHTGQEVDFSSHLKRDENGKLIMTDLKARTTKQPITTNDFPMTYDK